MDFLAEGDDGEWGGAAVFDILSTSSGALTLESAGWEGGRLLPGTGNDKILYHVTDHLGSVRVVKDGTGAVLQRFDYYPFGSVSGSWSSGTDPSQPSLRYRFGGKEIAGQKAGASALVGTPAAAAGRPYLDFGARLYDPRTAAWLAPDPLSEKYYPISPYAYCAGDPVNLVDPGGLSIRALGINAIDTFLNMLSDEELQYISFDSNGVLNNDLIASYSGNSILLNTIKSLSSSSVLYDFMISDNDGEEEFYDIDNRTTPGSYYYGVTRYPGARNKPSIDSDVHVFTASFLDERKKAENLGHELLGHGYFYELSTKDPSIKPTHVYKIISGPEELDEETGLMLSPAIRVSDMNAPIEKWIKQIEETIRDNFDRRVNR